MCFFSRQTKDATKVEKRFNAVVNDLVNFQPGDYYNGFEFPRTPVITNDNTGEIQQLQWGLIPHWAKNDDIKKYTINAKIETLGEKPSFRNSINKRCLVIADGFFEWQWLDPKGRRKQKYLLTLPNEELYAYAGIWSEWVSTQTGEVIRTYSIVTTEAQGIMREIHNSKKRMPVILTPENEKMWLQGSGTGLFKDVDIELRATKL